VSTFIPDQAKKASNVPYFEDVKSDQGWQGQATGKRFDVLKSEICVAIVRLGGTVTGFQSGLFQIESVKRQGFQVRYHFEAPNGDFIPGRLDIAALPVRPSPYSSFNARTEKSIKMALYMLRNSLDGLWFLQQLSPGYAPLMPFMLTGKSEMTISQLWSESAIMQNLLPPGDGEFVEEGHYSELGG